MSAANGGCRVLSAADETTGDDSCCYHDRPGVDEVVCCWCGDVYLREDERTKHGEYAPKSTRGRARRARNFGLDPELMQGPRLATSRRR